MAGPGVRAKDFLQEYNKFSSSLGDLVEAP